MASSTQWVYIWRYLYLCARWWLFCLWSSNMKFDFIRLPEVIHAMSCCLVIIRIVRNSSLEVLIDTSYGTLPVCCCLYPHQSSDFQFTALFTGVSPACCLWPNNRKPSFIRVTNFIYTMAVCLVIIRFAWSFMEVVCCCSCTRGSHDCSNRLLLTGVSRG